MTGDGERLAKLVEAIGRKNRLDAPLVTPVGIEIRTAIGFALQPDAEVKNIVSKRKGATAFHVVWEYPVEKDLRGEFAIRLIDREPELFDAAAANIRYLGTYIIREKPEDEPRYVTTWGCATKADALTVATESWTGPQGAEQAYKHIFRGFFERENATITSQGLAAAVAP